MNPLRRYRGEGEVESFLKAFGGAGPTHLSTAPGRVNLIGEHTDYNGLPVFPMALTRAVRVLFRPGVDARVRVVNLNSEFEPREFLVSQNISPGRPGDWGNYLKAPCQALARRFGSLAGMDALVTSSLPVASGLSSSSALVIAAGQAILAANGLALPPLDMAREMAGAERYTGTQGGGMDQAISLGGRAGHASRIEFDPLTLVETPIPPGWRFVVAHTLIRAEKSGEAQEAYNRRTTECAQALRTMRTAVARRLGPEALGFGYADLLDRVPETELLSLARDELPDLLLKRFRHVVTEAARVYGAEKAMREAVPERFGALMDASHDSLRGDYEVSCPELDTLVALAKEAGAAGARLTGAGFGGSIVALAGPGGVEGLMDRLRTGYYANRRPATPVEDALFVAESADGARVEAL